MTAYHVRTKHHPGRYASGPLGLRRRQHCDQILIPKRS